MSNARFWNRIAARYARQPLADEAAYQRKLTMTRERLAPDMDVLEIGCGTGSTAIAHAPHVREIHAVDVSSRMLEIAAAKAKDAGATNIRFEECAVDTLDVPDDRYGAVLALSILHLVADRERTLRQVFRVLEPGGLFISNTACIAGWMRALKPAFAIGRALTLLPLVQFFRQSELLASVEGAGFEIEEVWRPTVRSAVFIVARKPAEAA